MNAELKRLFEEDRQDHQNQPVYGTLEFWALRERDTERRNLVEIIVGSEGVKTPQDFYHAATIFQHSADLEDIWQAHSFAAKSAKMGYVPARSLAAATYDRWLMVQGKPQKYGTQFVPAGRHYRLWDVDPATSDVDRAEWGVPTLAEQLERAEEMTKTLPMPSPEDVPQWLKNALTRWAED